MISAELIADYRSIEKPFCLIERHAHCGGTDYATICRLSDEHARLLASEGISWLYGEPDWQKHHDKIAMLQAEKTKAEAEERIAALTSKGTSND